MKNKAMNEVLKKPKGKCIPYVITPEIRKRIKQFKERLIEVGDRPDETSEFDIKTIDIVFNQLDDYDRNLLFAYYELADCNYGELGRIFNIQRAAVRNKIEVIKNKIRELNDTPKTPNNQPRCNPCD